MGIWPKRDKKEEERRHSELEGKIRDAKKHHRTWVSQQFPNRAEVLRDAQYIVDDFEDEHDLDRGSIEVYFDDHGTRLGYYLKIRGTMPDERDLVARIRAKTGETFEVDHIFETS